MQNEAEVSVIVLTKNAQSNIHQTLSMILSQKTDKIFEIIVIDSGSTDTTVEIIKGFSNIRLIQRSYHEFGHGRTRNFGANASKAEFLVFLNGDAIPKDNNWLEALLKNFDADERIAGVYSRHIPKENCHIYMAVRILEGMKPIKQLQSFSHLLEIDSYRDISDFIRFSTVSCAIRKDIWDKIHFNEEIPHAEDQEWAKRALEMGYFIIYEPLSIIFHSHNYTLKAVFKYYYDDTKSFNAILGSNKPKDSFFYKIINFPYKIIISLYRLLKEPISVIRYARKKRYSLIHITKEVIITIVFRFSAFFGKVAANFI